MSEEYYTITFRVHDVTTKNLNELETIVQMTEEVVRSIFSECSVEAVATYQGILSDIEKVKE